MRLSLANLFLFNNFFKKMARYNCYTGKIINIIDEAANIKRFFIEVQGLEEYKFTAGQYVRLDLPVEYKKGIRYYSIANEPDGTNVIELLILLDPNGQATNYLFKQCSVGSEIRMSEPMGKFVVPEKIEKELCFICTGVGLAPLRSMIRDIYKRNIPHKDIHLVFGTRYKGDLVYSEEFNNLQNEFPEFHYHVTLSRENSTEWQGNQGYVHDVYKKIFHDGRDAAFFICGYKGMITDARNTLHSLGYTKHQIYFEKFD